jgi:hypothetical protein
MQKGSYQEVKTRFEKEFCKIKELKIYIREHVDEKTGYSHLDRHTAAQLAFDLKNLSEVKLTERAHRTDRNSFFDATKRWFSSIGMESGASGASGSGSAAPIGNTQAAAQSRQAISSQRRGIIFEFSPTIQSAGQERSLEQVFVVGHATGRRGEIGGQGNPPTRGCHTVQPEESAATARINTHATARSDRHDRVARAHRRPGGARRHRWRLRGALPSRDDARRERRRGIVIEIDGLEHGRLRWQRRPWRWQFVGAGAGRGAGRQ